MPGGLKEKNLTESLGNKVRVFGHSPVAFFKYTYIKIY